MAKYFRAPWEHPPTIEETAAHYRAQNIAAVIFPVDAEREPDIAAMQMRKWPKSPLPTAMF